MQDAAVAVVLELVGGVDATQGVEGLLTLVALDGHLDLAAGFEAVEALALRGVDTWAHLGLNPQIHHKRRLKARTALAAARVVKRARSLQEAGASFLVLELIPEEVGNLVTRRLTIPTIGIAAGRLTDGQVLVVTDVLGMGDREFRHVTRYTDFSVDGREALRRYVADVREGRFPDERHVGHLSAEERASLESGVMEEE